MTTKTHDVLVVGGGLGGLLAGALLSAAGREVQVLEGSSVTGGLGRSTKVGPLAMNLGAHALYLDGPAEKALRSLGVKVQGFSPGDGFWLDVDGALAPLPNTIVRLMNTNWLSWRERWQLAATMRAVLGAAPQGTLREWLDTLPSERVRKFLQSLSRVSTYTNAPEQLAASRAWPQLRVLASPFSRGVRYLDGGWESLVTQLRERVPVRLEARVKSVGAEGEVQLESGEVLRANDVVLAVPLQTAARLVDDAALKARAQKATPVLAACLDLVLRDLPKPERRLVLGLDHAFYFSVHTKAGAPVKVHVMEYLPPGGASSKERLEAFVDRVQPGWRERCEGSRFFPHLHVMEDLPRDEVVTLRAPLHLVTGVASSHFLFDAVADAALRVAKNSATKRLAAQ